MPKSWALTPCIGKKNMWPKWNSQPLDRTVLIDAIRNQVNAEGKPTAWTGVSLVTGLMSGSLMAVDFDGMAALDKYLELSGGKKPPATVKWTSGKPGHCQILLRMPFDRANLIPQKIELPNGDKLELRWNQCSTLPPSLHPDTGKPYYWENQDFEAIAQCPDWILDLMQAPTAQVVSGDRVNFVEILETEILPRLDAREFYGEFANLKKVGKNLVGLCPFHAEKTGSFTVSPDTNSYKCFGCGAGGGPVQFLHQIGGGSGSPSGKDFIAVVRDLARRVSVSVPEAAISKNPPRDSRQAKVGQESKIITHPKFEAPSLEKLSGEIDQLLAADLKRSELHLKFAELARTYRLSSSEISKAYYLKEEESEREADRGDVAAEIEALLLSHRSSITLSEVIPAGLAAPIEKLAGLLNLRTECYLAALLTQCSSLFKVGTETMLRRDSDWRCTPNYFAAIVAESSQKKSPIPQAMIERPMRPLRDKAKQDFEKALSGYESQMNEWKAAKKDEDRGPAPQPPREKMYDFSKATGEGIIAQVQGHPDQGLLWFADELAGLFKSANQYRGGKGSDEEDLLEFWGGRGARVLRASEVKANLDSLLLSIFGTIQPDVLAYLLKDCSDSNGKFARFDFVFQPLAASKLPKEDSGKFDLTPMLADLYQKIDALPAIFFELDREAKYYFLEFSAACDRRRVEHPQQGMRAALGKMPTKAGKLATVIHTLTCTFNGEPVSPRIPRAAVEAAVKFVKFAADQVASLYTEFTDRAALAPNLAKIVLLAERKGGIVSVRDAQHGFYSKSRPTAKLVREYFKELVTLGYGSIKSIGKSFQFEVAPTSTAPTVSSKLQSVTFPAPTSTDYISHSSHSLPASTVGAVGELWEVSPTVQNLTAKSFGILVGDVGDFSQLSENVRDCIKFIRDALQENDPETAKFVQQILAEQTTEEKTQIWSELTANEKSTFRLLLTAQEQKVTSVPTKPPQTLDSAVIESPTGTPTDSDSSHSEFETELLNVKDYPSFLDFADWLEDSEELERMATKIGWEIEAFWLTYKSEKDGQFP